MSDRDSSRTSTYDGRHPTLLWVREWILLDGNRLLLAGVLFVAFAAVIAGLQLADLVPLEVAQPTFYLFGGLVSGNLTLITVVVSINQLLLSRELGSPGELRSQIENVFQYHEEVADAAGRVPPAKPLGFLRLLLESTRQEAQRLGGISYNEVPTDFRTELTDIVGDVTSHVDEVDDLLKESDPDTFTVLSATLTTNYADQIHRIRVARTEHDLPEDVSATIDRLVHRIREIDVARQYFKSIYLQEELSELSRVLLYVGLPAEATAALVLLTFTTRSTTALPHGAFEVVIPLAVALGFLPLFVLASFVTRVATVTERTAATLPFTTPHQEVWPGVFVREE